jgi:hypothetical protein
VKGFNLTTLSATEIETDCLRGFSAMPVTISLPVFITDRRRSIHGKEGSQIVAVKTSFKNKKSKLDIIHLPLMLTSSHFHFLLSAVR